MRVLNIAKLEHLKTVKKVNFLLLSVFTTIRKRGALAVMAKLSLCPPVIFPCLIFCTL